MNTHPLHFNYEQAKKTEFKKAAGQFPADGRDPCRDERFGLQPEGRCQSRLDRYQDDASYDLWRRTLRCKRSDQQRGSEKRPTQGLVTVVTTGKNQDGVVVCTFECTMLIWKTGYGPGDD
jgi:itaconyl-CoA hydratase